MHAQKIISAGVVGTSLMTLFSHLVSAAEDSNFSEPELLGKLIHRKAPQLNETMSKLAGWQIHYAIGITFSLLYEQLWRHSQLKPNIKSGILLGAASGLMGLAFWKFTMTNHHNPPLIKFEKYYKQLVVAHIVFGIFAVVGYRLFKGRPSQHQHIPTQLKADSAA